MDFKLQQNFHPARSDLQPLPPGKRQLPLQPTPWLKLESSLFLTLQAQCHTTGWALLGDADTRKAGRQDREEGVGFHCLLVGSAVDYHLVTGKRGRTPDDLASCPHLQPSPEEGWTQESLTPTCPLSHPKHLVDLSMATRILMTGLGLCLCH